MSNSFPPNHIRANFRTIGKPGFDLIESSLRQNFFKRNTEAYLSTDQGKTDLENHLRHRLEVNRIAMIPWLDEARPLANSKILEIGGGTGCSTVALAEQGATVVAVDIDEDALTVARERCQVYGVNARFVQANAIDVHQLFAGETFDFIIFYASLEHLLLPERLAAMRATWEMLPRGALWCVVEAPNRLWYYDQQASRLPFFMWLPDELAFQYSSRSPRAGYGDRYRDDSEESRLHFLRRGRGVSFHEFDLAMKPVRELKVKSSLKMETRHRGLLKSIKWRMSDEYKYLTLLRKLAPDIDEGFLQALLYLIIEKD